jgi:hypothetical protein
LSLYDSNYSRLAKGPILEIKFHVTGCRGAISVGAVSRPESRLLLRRAIAWIAAYAFLLQAVLGPILMARVSSVASDVNQSLILCSGHAPDIGGTTGDIPSQSHDNDSCKFCLSCGFGFVAGSHEIATAWVEQPVSISVRWSATENPVPDGTKFFGKRARGPPLLT